MAQMKQKRCGPVAHSLFDPDDPRPLLPVVAVCGLVAWKLPLEELLLLCGAAVLAVFFCFMWPARGRLGPAGADRAQLERLARGALIFVLTWACIAFLLGLIGGEVRVSASTAGILALRLVTVSALGICLVGMASFRALTLAFGWYLRPVLGRRAWEAALALGLMIHFLPLVLQTLHEARTAVDLRLPQCPFRRRAVLVITTSLRRLSQSSWDQTIAVASRHLDRPEAWMLRGWPAMRPVLASLILCVSGVCLLYVRDIVNGLEQLL